MDASRRLTCKQMVERKLRLKEWDEFMTAKHSKSYYEEKSKEAITKVERKKVELEKKVYKIKQQIKEMINKETPNKYHIQSMTKELDALQRECSYQTTIRTYYEKLPSFLAKHIPQKERKSQLKEEIRIIHDRINEEARRKIEEETAKSERELKQIEDDMKQSCMPDCVHGDFTLKISPYQCCDMCKKCLRFSS